ncbi:MAG: hypothetical protein HQL20_09090 [Candidatus Omnitrophica bacterium]|nr:hypothetical protein [Candidatus Omnitrophota bacterium]
MPDKISKSPKANPKGIATPHERENIRQSLKKFGFQGSHRKADLYGIAKKTGRKQI